MKMHCVGKWGLRICLYFILNFYISLLHLTLLHTPVYWRLFNLICLLYLLSVLLQLHCLWIWHFLLLCFAALLSQPQPFSDGWTDVWCILKWFHHFPLAASEREEKYLLFLLVKTNLNIPILNDFFFLLSQLVTCHKSSVAPRHEKPHWSQPL